MRTRRRATFGLSTRRAPALLLIAVIALAALGAPPAGAYEGDHYVWTYYLALQVGYTPRQAFQVASGAFAIDWDPDTAPMPCGKIDELRTAYNLGRPALRETWRRYHAFVEQSASAGGFAYEEAAKRRRMAYLWLNALEDGNPGPFIHYTQDYYAHQGWEDMVGHLPYGHHPDFIGFNAEQRTPPMTDDTLAALTRFMVEWLGATPRAPDRARIDQVLAELVAVQTPPLTEEELTKAFPNWPISAALWPDLVINSDLYGTLMDANPSIDASLAVVRRAIRDDERAGRLPWRGSGFVEGFESETLPRKWFEYGFDPDAHPTGDRTAYAVEKPRLVMGEPEVKYARAGEDRVAVEIKVPYRVEGMVDTPSFMMPYPVLQIETLSGEEPTTWVEKTLGGEETAEAAFELPIARLREGSVSWKAVVQPYGLEPASVDVPIRPPDLDQPEEPETPPTDSTLTDLENLLDELRRVAAVATASGQRAGESCARARELAAAGLSARAEIAGRIEALVNAAAASAPAGDDVATLLARAREIAARGAAAAQALGPLRGEAGTLRDQACAPGAEAQTSPRGAAAARIGAIESEAVARYAEAQRALDELRWVASSIDGLARPRQGPADLHEIVASLRALEGRLRDGVGLVDQAVSARADLVAARARFADLASRLRAQLDTAGGVTAAGGGGAAPAQRAGSAAAAARGEIDQLTGQVQSAADAAESCDPDAARAELEAELRASESLRARVEAVLDRPASPGSAQAAEAAATVKGLIADLEASVAAAELFRDSILERGAVARDCGRATGPSTPDAPVTPDDSGQGRDDAVAPDDTGNPPGEPADSGGAPPPDPTVDAPPSDGPPPAWTIESGVVTVGQSPQPVPAAPPEPRPSQPSLVPSDPTASLIAGAEGAFARCDFVGALSLADRLAAIAPSHPWLGANYATIARLAGQQRSTVGHLQVAQSLLAAGQLKDARAALTAAARDAPGCMSSPIAGLVGEVNSALTERRAANREALSQGLGTLLGAVGQAAAVVAANQGAGATGGVVPSAGGHTHDASGRDVPAGGAAAGPRCVVGDWNPAFDARQLEGEGILWYVQAKTVSGMTFLSITAVGSPGMSDAERQSTLQRMRQSVGAEYYGPHRDAATAFQAAKTRCPNVIQVPPR